MTMNRFVIILLVLLVAVLKAGCVSTHFGPGMQPMSGEAVTASTRVCERSPVAISSVPLAGCECFSIRMLAEKPIKGFKFMSNEECEVLIDQPVLTDVTFQLERPAGRKTKEYTMFLWDESRDRYERHSLVLTNRGLVTWLSHWQAEEQDDRRERRQDRARGQRFAIERAE